ncbi:MAG: hypothetical protein Q9206_003311 [Seirophora lacunosa]
MEPPEILEFEVFAQAKLNHWWAAMLYREELPVRDTEMVRHSDAKNTIKRKFEEETKGSGRTRAKRMGKLQVLNVIVHYQRQQTSAQYIMG